MKYIVILFFSLALFSGSAYAQGKYKKHQVAKGETVTDIAKKYKVTPYDIYRLNPDSQNGINEGAILLVPTAGGVPVKTDVAVSEKSTKIANPIHEVQPKETLYGLSKQYNVSEEDLKKANPEIVTNGLQIGQKIIIPVKGSGVEAQAERAEKQLWKKDAPSYMYHTVEAGETKYSIAKDYGMSLQLLEELNPEVKDSPLPLGYKLKLDKNSIIAKEIAPGAQLKKPENQYIEYTVQPKETFYSLTRRVGITEQEIVALNPDAKDGLKEGMVLKLPNPNPDSGTVFGATRSYAPGISNLSVTLNKAQTKQLALLLPFNINKGADDESEKERVRTNKFLNMTLDFYAGALIAIDSAQAMGIPVKVKILDSQESSTSSAIDNLRGGLVGVDAVIGPFFQNNVEKTAQILAGIPIISPLSKEAGKPLPNLYQSVPTQDMVRMAMLDYLKFKSGNVIAVIDEKKLSSKQFIRNNYAGVKFADGTITEDIMKPLLDPSKMNYIVLDTESAGKVSNTVRVLSKLMADYQIQLAVMERTDILDNEEVPLKLLTRLRMLYPSVTNDSENPMAAGFIKKFKAKNGVMPNQFASRGFDVTLDVILRMYQPEGFAETIATKASQQTENKFVYRTLNGGNYNNGVYILNYEEDLSIKQAN
ncbi:LysM peptidoglycan-binding domain-containing protein [Flavobacterium alkalisoli]|uniref:LysM peptidoglycan-binding domain-containing protein n=1 Tax=Flavobacterium alkalisoli TaxID=2602769 RepID=A0A5B9FYM0_9FLAO|nr:LysM peptidoglycan-binding domain-containing protein [Flavobacterium alkalisoli]QEE51126.1 LysM peptidoglycan-binding domain-containing protein [Flavobacterium alkalisoli]